MNFQRNPWPVGIALVFVFFFASLVVVVVLASRQSDSLVSENYYEQELKYQDQLAAMQRAKTTGAQVVFDVKAGKLQIALPPEQLKQNFSGSVFLYRASASGMDREISLKPDESGRQTIDMSQLAPGLWLVRLSWKANGQDYFLEQKLHLGRAE